MDQSPTYQYQGSTQPQVPSKKPLIFGIVVVAAILIGVSILALNKSSEHACISPADYQSFYGEVPLETHFDPKTSFYSKTYLFLPASSTVDTNESDSPSIDAASLARFYVARQNKPMVFTVSTAYDEQNSDATKSIAEQRVAFLSDTLKKAGIPADIITSEISTYITTSEERPDGIDTASVNLASAASCQE